MAASHGFEP